jgi:hypothetical protein
MGSEEIMRDFTLGAYIFYLKAIKSLYSNVLRFDEFFHMNPRPETFCLLRHDVDRWPKRALQMAKVEEHMGIHSTYYFRAKSCAFNPEIIRGIALLGHEVGYHYECLSDANGDISRALENFENNLEKFREIAPIKTISMHGRPLSPFDNRDMWRNPENHRLLLEKYGILGEVYLDIDYKEIAYINDTGRNWTSSKSNIRDKIESNIKLDFENGQELRNYLESNPHSRMVFQVHPERWSNHTAGYGLSFCIDLLTNFSKNLIALARNRK